MIKRFFPLYKTYLFLILFVCGAFVNAQNTKQKQLEAQRREFMRQINQFERLMSQGKKEQKTILSNLDNINSN